MQHYLSKSATYLCQSMTIVSIYQVKQTPGGEGHIVQLRDRCKQNWQTGLVNTSIKVGLSNALWHRGSMGYARGLVFIAAMMMSPICGAVCCVQTTCSVHAYIGM